MMILSMLIFGTIGIFRRYIPLPSAVTASARGLIGGAILFLVICIRKRKDHGKLPARTLFICIVSGALIGINWMLLFEAYNHTTVAAATLSYYMQPVIVILLSPIVLKEKLTLRKAVCAAAAVAGMVLVSGVTTGSTGPGDRLGIIFGLGAAAFYSAVIFLNKFTDDSNVLKKTAVQLISAGAVLIPYILLSEDFGAVILSPVAVALLIFVGAVHTGLAHILFFRGIGGLSAQSAAILSYIDPVSAVLLSALLLKEPIRTSTVIGAVLIIGSAIISEL